MEIFTDFQVQIGAFFKGLDWTYILMFSFVVFGIRYKDEFKWYVELTRRHHILYQLRIWIAGLVVLGFFCLFKGLGSGLGSEYVSAVLRSFMVVIIFNSAFTKKIHDMEDGSGREDHSGKGK